jgi:hypothetical protein
MTSEFASIRKKMGEAMLPLVIVAVVATAARFFVAADSLAVIGAFFAISVLLALLSGYVVWTKVNPRLVTSALAGSLIAIVEFLLGAGFFFYSTLAETTKPVESSFLAMGWTLYLFLGLVSLGLFAIIGLVGGAIAKQRDKREQTTKLKRSV